MESGSRRRGGSRRVGSLRILPCLSKSLNGFQWVVRLIGVWTTVVSVLPESYWIGICDRTLVVVVGEVLLVSMFGGVVSTMA